MHLLLLGHSFPGVAWERLLSPQYAATELRRASGLEEFQAALELEAWDAVVFGIDLERSALEAAFNLLQPRLEELPLVLLSNAANQALINQLLGKGAWDAVDQDQLGRLAATLERFVRLASKRRRAPETQTAGQRGEGREAILLNAFPASLVQLDHRGTIVAANARWEQFALENPLPDGGLPRHCGIGTNYLATCRASQGRFSEGAMAAHDGICSVLAGIQPAFKLEYPCHSPTQERWFLMTATPLKGEQGQGAIVTHVDITEWRWAETRHKIQRDLALALAAATDLDQGLALCVKAALQVARLDCGGFYLRDANTGALELHAPAGLPASFVQAVSFFDANSPLAQLAAAGKPVYAEFNTIPLGLQPAEAAESLHPVAIIPLLHEGHLVGCLNVASHRPGGISEVARQGLETIAASASQAIVRLQAQEALREHARLQTLSATVLGILNRPHADLPTIAKEILTAVRQTTGIEGAGLRLQVENDFPLAYSEGFPSGFIQSADSLVSPSPQAANCLDEHGRIRLDCLCGAVLTGQTKSQDPLFTPGGSVWTNDARVSFGRYKAQQPDIHLRGECFQAGFNSIALVPIRDGQDIVGLLQLCDRRKGVFCAESMQHFEGLAANIGLALGRLKEIHATQAHERFLRLATEAGKIGMFEIDAKDGRGTLSAETAALWGLESDFSGDFWRYCAAHVHPEDSARVQLAFAELLETETAQDLEFRIAREDGQVRWLRWRGRRIKAEGPDGGRIVGVNVDITKRKELEREREHALIKYQTLFNTLPLGVTVTDKQGRIIESNQQAREILGMLDQEHDQRHIGDAGWKVLRPDDTPMPPEEFASVRALREQRCIENTELGLVRPNGKTIWLNVTAAPVALPGIGVVITYSDISARKQAEEDIRSSEERLRAYVEQTADALFVHDLAGRFTAVNRAACASLGYTREELLRLSVPDVDIGINQMTAQAAWLQVGPAQQNPKIVGMHRRKDGSTFPVEISFGCFDLHGERYILGLVRDITERIQAERNLRENAERLQALVRASSDVVYQMSADWSEMRRLVGRAFIPDTTEPSTGWIERYIHPDDHGRLRATIRQAIEAKGVFELEHRVVRLDGTLGHVFSRAVPILDANGAITDWLGMASDLTGRKELEAQFYQAQKLEAVGQLAGGVAHDFNNILAAINLNLDLMQMDNVAGPTKRQMLQELKQETQRGVNLIRQLLMFSRRSVLAVAPIDLNGVIENLLKMLRRLVGENIEVRFDSQTTFAQIEADAGMMEQVLMNLVVNARDAMSQSGRITISTARREITAETAGQNSHRRPGTFVRLTVADTGCGMNEATLRRIFEPFFTTKEAGKGTGLGLATVDGIVAQHKGWIEVESLIGKGSTFYVYLPASNQLAKGETDELVDGPLPCGHETILLVEDDRHLRELIKRSLRSLGYQVHTAANGAEALTLWQERGAEIQLLLTDVVMPGGISGVELAQRLCAQKPALRVIISSGYNSEMVCAGKPLDPNLLYLPKPYELSKLARTIRTWLEKSQSPKS